MPINNKAVVEGLELGVVSSLMGGVMAGMVGSAIIKPMIICGIAGFLAGYFFAEEEHIPFPPVSDQDKAFC
jgi:hypothetical protein